MSTLIKNAILFTALAIPTFAQAQDATSTKHPMLGDTFVFGLGAYFPTQDIELSVNGSSPGDIINFNKEFNTSNNSTSGSAYLQWRFGQKWVLSGQYWNTDNSNKAVLQEDIKIRDTVFTAGSNIEGGNQIDIYRVFLGYAFSQSDNHEFGAGAGLHILDLNVFVQGNVIVNGVDSGFKREAGNTLAPLPNLGMWYYYSWDPKWLISTNLDWMAASGDILAGDIWDVNVALNYQAFEHVGFSAGYQYFKLGFNIDENNFQGSLNFPQDGPFVKVTANW